LTLAPNAVQAYASVAVRWVVPLLLVAVGAACSASNGAPGGDGAPCTTNAACASGETCAYLEADGCRALGSCVTRKGPLCNLFIAGCACDGTGIDISGCDGLPSGYVAKPFAHSGACN
jgi:hypothetical protein